MNTNGATPLFEDASASNELRSFVAMARSDGPSQADLDRLAARLGPAVGLSAGVLASGVVAMGTPPVGVASALSPAAAKVGAFGKLMASTGGKLLAVGLSVGIGAGLWALAGQKPDAPVASQRSAEPAPIIVEAPRLEPTVTAAAAPDAPTPGVVKSQPPSTRARARAALVKPAAVEPVVLAEPKPSELSLIQQAEAARSRSSEALAILARHEQLYPRGALAQEREVLAIEVLLKAGNAAQARARAQRFEAANPGSAHLSRLRALLERAE